MGIMVFSLLWVILVYIIKRSDLPVHAGQQDVASTENITRTAAIRAGMQE